MNSKIRFFTIFSLLYLFVSPVRASTLLVDPLVPVDSAPFTIWILGTECRDPSQDLVEFLPEQNLFQISLILTASTCAEKNNPAGNTFRTRIDPLPVGDYDILYKGFAVNRQPVPGEQKALTFSVIKQIGFVDVPIAQEVLSGKGAITGWACEGRTIEVAIDDGPKMKARSGLNRPDTQPICGDSNNGYELNMNWNKLGAGPRTLRVFADGVQFASVNVIVRPVVKGQLETPSAGSDESGIGLIGGWVCDAEKVTVLIDGFPEFDAIYGSPRGDTRTECGDDPNGFGLVINWGLLGDGQHSLRVFADGIQFGSASFKVKTFGVPFFRHPRADFRLTGFPDATQDTIISWSQAHQKFLTSNIVPTSGAPAPVVDPPENPVPENPVPENPVPENPVPDNQPPPANVPIGFLESPQQQEVLSGQGKVRGWVCEANVVEASVDDQSDRIPLNYPIPRPDTNAVCGDSDNGFELADIDWDLIGAGSHVIHVFADGVEIVSVNVTVQPVGLKTALTPLADDQLLEVREIPVASKQGSIFAATDLKAAMDTPVQASFESGIGVIQGWACNARKITVELDGGKHKINAIYGVDRSDTESICGDRNNGFGLFFNWGLLADGEHRIQVLADGVQFGFARFTVRTYGVPFLVHPPQDYSLEDFPEPGRKTIVRWAQSQQNFVVVGVQ